MLIRTLRDLYPFLHVKVTEVVTYFNGKNNLNYNVLALVWSGIAAKNERLF